MKYRRAILLAALLLTACGRSPVKAIDGDTLDVGGERIRIFGIDAPEMTQRCTNEHGFPYACGYEAFLALGKVIRDQHVNCSALSRDTYGRTLARCYVGTLDLGEYMVRSGNAVAYTRYSLAYRKAEMEAESARRGIWRGTFTHPEIFRRERRASAP